MVTCWHYACLQILCPSHVWQDGKLRIGRKALTDAECDPSNKVSVGCSRNMQVKHINQQLVQAMQNMDSHNPNYRGINKRVGLMMSHMALLQC